MHDLEVPLRDRAAPKRVVIVDDSQSMRMWLRSVLDNDTRLQVVGEAGDADQARAVIKELKPDVITLDISMPGMSGLSFLDRLMKLHPMPVVMLSGDTEEGSAATVQSLALGAVDCIVKPDLQDMARTKRDLVRRVFAAACSHARVTKPPPKAYVHRPVVYQGRMPIVLIGASTGGVAALETVLHALNPSGPPVVIVQHMPSEFLVSFAQMLNRHLQQEVGMVFDGCPLKAGQVMLAPAFDLQHTRVHRVGGAWRGTVTPAEGQHLHHPSVDVLFNSAVEHGPDTIAVLLTGLGRDGAMGMKSLADAGAQTIGQDEGSCVVYGMPRAAFEAGGVQHQMSLDLIGGAVNRLAQNHQSAQVEGGI